VEYPRLIESVHQVEVSSRCNLRCVYCPSKDLDKPKEKGGSAREMVDISWDHYLAALDWAQWCDSRGTQGEFALTGIGEALLHPRFVEMIAEARRALPTNPITFSTNGLLLTPEICEEIKPYRPQVFVSLHRPEKAKGAVDAATNAGILAGVNASFALEAFDWAGQLDWDVTVPEDSVTCAYLNDGWCVVLADGRITTCCLDATGSGVVGSVTDEPGSLSISPWSGDGPLGRKVGCEQCHMNVP
jgi:hypothetical protein